jgi:co-chaperonin GroES (HSP10)
MAKISFARYRTVRDTNDGVIQTTYDVPTYNIDGHKYIMLDQRDIIWVFDKKEEKDEIV